MEKIKEICMYNMKFDTSDIVGFLKRQLDKITEEYNELRHAIVDYFNNPNSDTLAHLYEESWDLSQASFGIPNNMQDKHGLEDSNHKHISKLIEREGQ